jgi:RimJ/RimL family protein N-acetyltransferase
MKLMATIEAETNFMLYGANERKMSKEQCETMIASIQNKENSVLLVIEEEELVGFIMVIGSKAPRNKHVAYLATGMKQRFISKGLGTVLLQEIETWAKQRGITRLELTVMTHNAAGIALYKKMGFEAKGTKKRSLLVNGE